MYPLTRASENFRKALKMANEISVEQETRYVGSEHFIYAFLCLPECSAYGILTREGVYYVPYVVLSVLAFPAILLSTEHMISGLAAAVVCAALAFWRKGLITCMVGSVAAALISEMIFLLI